MRNGKDPSGLYWQQFMRYDYGEIQGTLGLDKRPVNVILGDNLSSDKVFICTMPPSKSGEDKCLIGFNTFFEAKQAFMSCYKGSVDFLHSISCVSVGKFKRLLASRRGFTLLAEWQSNDYTTILNMMQPLPTGWNTEVENPGDRDLTPDERAYNTELARRQGGAPSYAEISQGGDINISPAWIYSSRK